VSWKTQKDGGTIIAGMVHGKPVAAEGGARGQHHDIIGQTINVREREEREKKLL
jgi:hypothetical protein